MALTLLLLAPVAGILVWLYARLIPGGWKTVDWMLVGVVLAASGTAAHWALGSEWENAGPLWHALLASVSAYGVLLVGLGLALGLRRALGSEA